MKRLTEVCWRNLDPWECCGQDRFCHRGCHDLGGCTGGCIVPKLYARLAAYEDTGLEPEEIETLLAEREGALSKCRGDCDECAYADKGADDFPCCDCCYACMDWDKSAHWKWRGPTPPDRQQTEN